MRDVEDEVPTCRALRREPKGDIRALHTTAQRLRGSPNTSEVVQRVEHYSVYLVPARGNRMW
jgi:hypothetical protein